MSKAVIIGVDGKATPLVLTHDSAYKSLNETVGGYIEAIYVGNGASGYINEEGKLDGLNINLRATMLCKHLLPGDYIVGPLVIVGPPDEEGWDTDAPEWALKLAEED